MRKSTLLWLMLALFCGVALFHTSERVHGDREKISLLERGIGKEEESTRLLQAEWGYLNQPERLEKLAARYLTLSPLKGSQFTTLEKIPLRSAVIAAAGNALQDPKLQPGDNAPATVKKLPPKKAAGGAIKVLPAGAFMTFASSTISPQKKHVWSQTGAGTPPAPTSLASRKFDDVIKNLGVE